MSECSNCGKDVSKAKWLDVKLNRETGKYFVIAEVVDFDNSKGKYSLGNIELKAEEVLLSVFPKYFDIEVLTNIGRDVDDVGAYCMACGHKISD